MAWLLIPLLSPIQLANGPTNEKPCAATVTKSATIEIQLFIIEQARLKV
jgi:hypothetical protein